MVIESRFSAFSIYGRENSQTRLNGSTGSGGHTETILQLYCVSMLRGLCMLKGASMLGNKEKRVHYFSACFRPIED